ncbi:hypothetical protein DSO57_1032647 [Entomophthora muscae]|uniref:Uncharacterized protein n=1 Tax=Entomophthora muscae TaxID=34485 RepID=A0ACC2TB88_9FUNG|nr:hypothetical protein DSO57_1032647 [Entomophthora muscae]
MFPKKVVFLETKYNFDGQKIDIMEGSPYLPHAVNPVVLFVKMAGEIWMGVKLTQFKVELLTWIDIGWLILTWEVNKQLLVLFPALGYRWQQLFLLFM